MTNRNHAGISRCAFLSAIALGLAALPLRAATNAVYGGTYTNWPSYWGPLISLNDPHDSGFEERCDFVGDSNTPCAYFAKDGGYLFFRTRVHTNVSAFSDSIFIFVDAVGSGPENVPEYGFAWDTQGSPASSHGLEFMISNVAGSTWATTELNDLDANSGQKYSPPDFALTGGEGYIRVIDSQPTTNFGMTTLIDWALSINVITARTALTMSQWRIQLGSRQNATDHNPPTGDVAGTHNPTDPGLSWSAAFEVPEAGLLAFLPVLPLLWRRGMSSAIQAVQARR